ncbi:hypothetical protein AB0469_08445 [Streptomyces sp. NPDC093801]|uniref:hypothetical protein n=1 Tax=Streptomyces sp. NPDC093801 TaxID=3155203 RepID=UPI00344E9DBF
MRIRAGRASPRTVRPTGPTLQPTGNGGAARALFAAASALGGLSALLVAAKAPRLLRHRGAARAGAAPG